MVKWKLEVDRSLRLSVCAAPFPLPSQTQIEDFEKTP
jgi:hypothetical protein